jgi:hypothetical protein
MSYARSIPRGKALAAPTEGLPLPRLEQRLRRGALR